MNEEPWYKAYPSWSAHVDLLSEFTEKGFNETIPLDHQLNINKSTLHEACVWLKYARAIGVYPTTKQINTVRAKKSKYSVTDFYTHEEDNYGEHF